MSRTIYWIDDDTDIIDPVVSPLVCAGHHIMRLRTVMEALEAVEQIRQADLILLDMILPPGQTDRQFSYYSGIDLLQELREVHGVTTPVVIFSVVDPEKTLQELKNLDVVYFVRKPALPSELQTAVEEALGEVNT